MNIKPILGTKINFHQHVAKNCVGAWLMNESAGIGLENLVNQKFSTTPGIKWSSNSHGACISLSLNQLINLGPANSLFKDGTDSFSFVLGVQKSNTVLNNAWNFGLVNQFYTQIPNSDNQIVFNAAGITLTAASYSYANEKDLQIWTVTASVGRGMEIWQGSNLIASNPSATPFIITTGNDINIGGKAGNYCFLYAYNKALTPTEIRSISDEPYQMFQKAPIQYLYSELSDVRINGVAEFSLYSDDIGKGGSRLGGVARPTYIPTSYLPTGGVVGAGNALDLRVKIANLDGGGIVIGGIAVPGISVTTFGGARLGGLSELIVYDIVEEVLDGEGGKLGGRSNDVFNYFPISSGGVGLSGVARALDFINGRGGIVVSGTVVVLPGSTSAFGTNGINCSGTSIVGWYIQERIGSFGVTLSGRATNTKRGQVRDVHSGYGYAMKNNNIIKARLAKKLLPVSIFVPSILPQKSIDDKRLEQTAEWCYIEDCSNNVLPRIVEKRQGVYLPPRTSNKKPRNRDIAQATGI